MADTKISALTSASTPLAGTEVLPIVQSGTTVKVAVSNLTAGRTVYSAAVAGNLASGTSFAPKNVGFITPDSSAYANPSVWNGAIENVATFGLINLNSGSLTASKYQAGVVGIARVNNSGVPGASNAVFGVLGTTSNAYGGGVNNYAVGAIGKAYVSDNIDVGTAAKGVNFTANTPAAGMTSQLLNWYEEGTWTPAFEFATPGNASFTYTTQTGWYTRIGNLVTVQFAVVVSATTVGTGSGNLLLATLPFTSKTGLTQSGVISYASGYTTNMPTTVEVASASAKLVFISQPATAAGTVITNTNVPAGATSLYGAITYMV